MMVRRVRRRRRPQRAGRRGVMGRPRLRPQRLDPQRWKSRISRFERLHEPGRVIPAWSCMTPGPALSELCCVLVVGFCGLLLVGLVVAILDPFCASCGLPGADVWPRSQASPGALCCDAACPVPGQAGPFSPQSRCRSFVALNVPHMTHPWRGGERRCGSITCRDVAGFGDVGQIEHRDGASH